MRGTGGSFATNVGGRMIGTSAAFLTANVVAPMFKGSPFDQMAQAAGWVGLGIVILSLIFGFGLPAGAHEVKTPINESGISSRFSPHVVVNDY